ncbi:reductase, partial [Lunasporangiospora selenospora]
PDSVSAPSQHLGFQCDVSIQKDVDRVIKEIASVGPIDHLIHSAGIVKDNLLVLQSTPDIESLIQNNLMGTIWVNKAVAKVMLRQRKGAIVNISSISGVYGNVGQTVYSATKAAMIGFSKSLSKELGSRGITVNTIAPGYTETDMMT